jgi:NDP-sugar pyrophosphorylase family protein
MNVVIPLAGQGRRFQERGYTFPKPLIEIGTKPMIQVVVANLDLDGRYIFVCLKEHVEKYELRVLLELIAPRCEIIITDGITEGAACSVLLAERHIDNDDELIIANSDQWVNWSSSHFLEYARRSDTDGAILTFYSTNPIWSFARVNEDGFITEVAEKKPISSVATCGIYYYRRGRDFVLAAKRMIAKNLRVNNEFYVCPVYNEMIAGGARILNYPVAEMRGLGTPEDLERFIRVKGFE